MDSGVAAVNAYQVEPSLTAASAVAGNCDSLLSCCQAYGWESASNREAAMTPARRSCICSVDSGMVEVPKLVQSGCDLGCQPHIRRRSRLRSTWQAGTELRRGHSVPEGRTRLK